MRLIARATLRRFWERHPDAEGPLRAWARDVKAAKWTGTTPIKSRYSSVSFVGENRIIFNIGGNKYRLVVHVRFDVQVIYVRFIGTHVEYDRIDAGTV